MVLGGKTAKSGREEMVLSKQVVAGSVIITRRVVDTLTPEDIAGLMNNITNQKLQAQRQIANLQAALAQMDSDYDEYNQMLNQLTVSTEIVEN